MAVEGLKEGVGGQILSCFTGGKRHREPLHQSKC